MFSEKPDIVVLMCQGRYDAYRKSGRVFLRRGDGEKDGSMASSTRIQRIGKNIKMYRDQVDVTQDDLAQRVGFASGATISAIEAGEKAPSVEKLMDIAIQLGVGVGQLVGEQPAAAAHITNNANGDHQTVYQHVEGLLKQSEELQAALRDMVREELAVLRAQVVQDVEAALRQVVRAFARPREAGALQAGAGPDGPAAPSADA
jgi:transcriptional regulator with XRE-family HTH domain